MVCICQWLFTGQSNRTTGADAHPWVRFEIATAQPEPPQTDSSHSAPLLSGQVICEGCTALHGTGTAAALQLCQPTVLGSKRDGVLTPERVLLQTPALSGTTGPHGHHGQLDPVPSDVSPGVRETCMNK